MESSSPISTSEDDDEVHFEDWVIKLNIGRVQVSQSSNSELPTQYFCLISLLLEGTAVEYGSAQLTHRCTEPDIPAKPPAFSIEPLRSTELCTDTALTDTTNTAALICHEQHQQHVLAQESGSGGTYGARRAVIAWDESFTLGASHPDLCLGRAADAAFGPAADADADALDEDEVAGHAELRPPLRGQVWAGGVGNPGRQSRPLIATLDRNRAGRRSSSSSRSTPSIRPAASRRAGRRVRLPPPCSPAASSHPLSGSSPAPHGGRPGPSLGPMPSRHVSPRPSLHLPRRRLQPRRPRRRRKLLLRQLDLLQILASRGKQAAATLLLPWLC